MRCSLEEYSWVDDMDVRKQLTEAQHADLHSLLQKFNCLFHSSQVSPGRADVVKHHIVTAGPPIRQPLCRLAVSLQSTVATEVDKMLKNDVIRPSHSPWSSPVVIVRKRDGSWRFCIDFRKVNNVTHRDAYPLPHIDSTLESLSGSAYFTTLDLFSAMGYWQVELQESSKEKIAFSTPNGH